MMIAKLPCLDVTQPRSCTTTASANGVVAPNLLLPHSKRTRVAVDRTRNQTRLTPLRITTITRALARQIRDQCYHSDMVSMAKRLIVQTHEDQGISGAKGWDQGPAFDAMLKDAVRRRYDIPMVWGAARQA
jgi:hypothetical protein